MTTTTLTFTRFTATTPPILTKCFSLTPEGKLHKAAAAQMADGQADQIKVRDLAEFVAVLEALKPSQATAYGVAPGHQKARIVSQKKHAEGDGAITRTRRYFQFTPTPGILMLDYDPAPGAEPLQGQQLLDAIIGAAPCLTDAPVLWRPSASSLISAADGREMTGITGQRLYIAVADASRIPAAGAALETLLWAAGFGRVDVGVAGQLLMRTLIDTTVWQPERLDFSAPPILESGLTRRPISSWSQGAGGFDLRRLIDSADGSAQATATKAQCAARGTAKAAAAAALDAWISERAPSLAAERRIDPEAAAGVLRRAAEHLTLTGDFMLTTDDGDSVSVGELLDRPERWHGRRFADPLDRTTGPTTALPGRICAVAGDLSCIRTRMGGAASPSPGLRRASSSR